MFTVLCRQSTGAFLYVIRKSNIMSDMLTWKYIGVLSIKGKHNFKQFYHTHIVEIPTQKGKQS